MTTPHPISVRQRPPNRRASEYQATGDPPTGTLSMVEERLETPKQLAARVGITERQVRHLIHTGQLEHVMIGSRVHIPLGAFGRFLETSMVKSCHVETKDQGCAGSPSAIASTSHGQSAAAAASARLVRQTANKLKTSSRSGCSAEGAVPAQVIRLPSS